MKKQPPRVFLGKGVLKICRSLQEKTHAEVRFQSNFIEIALRHGCSPVNLLHIFSSDFIEIALRHGSSLVNLLHIFRTPFLGTPLGGCFCK